ncbi:plasmid replication protein, CyRepA1 family, partial [Acaryochloris marina NIES-2412]|uniref:plasmid replication protein, CyRepA1 family n=1 Tax=Acaryochloris marina TaxID=155978 RepID=UPI00405A1E0B
SDSQRQCQIAEEIFELRGYPVLRVDSKTSTSKEVKDFLKDPDTYLEDNQPRVLIYSPTAESGLSVGIKDYFYKGFGLFFGVLPISSMTQMMQRVRDLGEIAIWCRKYAFSEEYDGNRSPFPKRVRELMMDYIQADAIASMTGTDREVATQQWFQKLLQALDDPHLTTHNILAAALNYEQQHTWECLKAVLIETGHHVAIIDKLQADHLKAQSTEIRERILDTDAATIYDAKDITMEAAIRIKSRWSSSLDERWSCEKAFLQHRLPGIQLTEI